MSKKEDQSAISKGIDRINWKMTKQANKGKRMRKLPYLTVEKKEGRER